jgi:hypothetical protein
MNRRLLILLTATASVAAMSLPSSAADPEPVVSLVLNKVAAERQGRDIHFTCELTLDNELGRELGVRSNFGSACDGLEIVVTTPEGKVLAQQGYTFHQSPFSATGRVFPLKEGKTRATLLFPIGGLSADVRALKVRVVGTLPGSGYERILSSETLPVEVKERANSPKK